MPSNTKKKTTIKRITSTFAASILAGGILVGCDQISDLTGNTTPSTPVSNDIPEETVEQPPSPVVDTPPVDTTPVIEEPAPAPVVEETSVEKGKKLFTAQCLGCHNGYGPKLSGIFDREIGGTDGYKYSAGFTKQYNTATSTDKWSPKSMDKWLEAPMQAAPGTKMAFPGVKDKSKRSNIIEYLQTLKP